LDNAINMHQFRGPAHGAGIPKPDLAHRVAPINVGVNLYDINAILDSQGSKKAGLQKGCGLVKSQTKATLKVVEEEGRAIRPVHRAYNYT
jgi:hypothetical protein